MTTISKTGIGIGGIVQAEHLTRIIDALNESGSAEIIATGSFSGSFTGDGSGLISVISSSFATTSSYALNTDTNPGIFSLTGSVYATTNNLEITGSLVIPKDTGSGYIIESITRTTKQYVTEGNASNVSGHPSGSGILPGSIALIGLKNANNTVQFNLGAAAESTVGDQYEFIISAAAVGGSNFLRISAAAGDRLVAKIFGADNVNQFNGRSPVITRISTGDGNARPGDRIMLTNIDDSGADRAWYVEAFVSGAAGYILD